MRCMLLKILSPLPWHLEPPPLQIFSWEDGFVGRSQTVVDWVRSPFNIPRSKILARLAEKEILFCIRLFLGGNGGALKNLRSGR